MGVGPNYVLGKGFLVEGSTAVVFGRVAIPGTGEQSAVTPSATSATVVPLGIWQENVDTTRVGTGKVFANVQMAGLSRAEVGAAVNKGDRLTYDNQGRVTPITRAAAGAQPATVLAVALTAATTAGQHIDVDLSPRGSTY